MAKGRIIPANEMPMERRAFRLMTVASISSPTRKRNRQRPMFAVRFRNGMDAGGNTCSVKPGICPELLS